MLLKEILLCSLVGTSSALSVAKLVNGDEVLVARNQELQSPTQIDTRNEYPSPNDKREDGELLLEALNARDNKRDNGDELEARSDKHPDRPTQPARSPHLDLEVPAKRDDGNPEDKGLSKREDLEARYDPDAPSPGEDVGPHAPEGSPKAADKRSPPSEPVSPKTTNTDKKLEIPTKRGPPSEPVSPKDTSKNSKLVEHKVSLEARGDSIPSRPDQPLKRDIGPKVDQKAPPSEPVSPKTTNTDKKLEIPTKRDPPSEPVSPKDTSKNKKLVERKVSLDVRGDPVPSRPDQPAGSPHLGRGQADKPYLPPPHTDHPGDNDPSKREEEVLLQARGEPVSPNHPTGPPGSPHLGLAVPEKREEVLAT